MANAIERKAKKDLDEKLYKRFSCEYPVGTGILMNLPDKRAYGIILGYEKTKQKNSFGFREYLVNILWSESGKLNYGLYYTMNYMNTFFWDNSWIHLPKGEGK